MKNRHLYRGKRIDNGEWVEGAYYVEPYTERSFIIRWNSTGLGFNEFIEVDEKTICQCTGREDKNGKLIWENDIVKKENGNLYKAFWQDNYYQFSWICIKAGKMLLGAKWNLWSIKNFEIEVIGNTFDNPELLEM